MSTPTIESTTHEILDLKRMREELDATIPAKGGCVQPVGTGDDSGKSEVRDGKCDGQGQEDWAAAYYKGGYSDEFPEALRYLYGG